PYAHPPYAPPSFPTRRSSDLLVNPEIDDVVKKDIRKDGADPRPLRRARLHRSPLAALKDAGLEPPLNQAEHPGVGDPVRQHPHQDRKSTRLNSSHVAISYAVF